MDPAALAQMAIRAINFATTIIDALDLDTLDPEKRQQLLAARDEANEKWQSLAPPENQS